MDTVFYAPESNQIYLVDLETIHPWARPAGGAQWYLFRWTYFPEDDQYAWSKTFHHQVNIGDFD